MIEMLANVTVAMALRHERIKSKHCTPLTYAKVYGKYISIKM